MYVTPAFTVAGPSAAPRHASWSNPVTPVKFVGIRGAFTSKRAKQMLVVSASASPESSVQPLAARELVPIIAPDGTLAIANEGGRRVAVFAVFGDDRALNYVGISRDVATSMRMCLARRPLDCMFFAVEYVARPSRTLLDSIRNQWLSEWEAATGAAVPGCDGGVQQHLWENAIDVRGPHVQLSEAERSAIADAEPKDLPKILKQTCRRFQGEIEQTLRGRGLTEPLKFASKLKNQGLLDIESVQIKTPDSIGTSTRRTDLPSKH
jgi:hypothetical protein